MSWGSWVLIIVYGVLLAVGADPPARRVAVARPRACPALRRCPTRSLEQPALAARAGLGEHRARRRPRHLHRHPAQHDGRAAAVEQRDPGPAVPVLRAVGRRRDDAPGRDRAARAAPAPQGLLGGALAALCQPLGPQPPEKQTVDALIRADLAFLAIELVLIGLLLAQSAHVSSASHAAAASLITSGPYALPFWGVVVVLGMLVPLALQALELGHRIPHTVVPALLVLVGGFTLRWVMVNAGQAEPHRAIASLANEFRIVTQERYSMIRIIRSPSRLIFAAQVVLRADASRPGRAEAQAVAAGFCANCHKAAAGRSARASSRTSRSSPSRSSSKIDADTEIVRFDPKTIKVVDGGVGKPAEHAARHREEPRGAHRLRREGRRQARDARSRSRARSRSPPEKLSTTPRSPSWWPAGPDKGNYTLIDSRPLPRFQEGTIPTAINLPFIRLRQVRRPPAQGQDPVGGLLLPGRHLHDEPELAAQGRGAGLHQRQGLPRGHAGVAEKNFGVLTPQFLKEAWIDKDIPHVLIDARPADRRRRPATSRARSRCPRQQLPRRSLKSCPTRS